MVVGMGRHMLFALPLIWDMRYALLYPVCHYLYPLEAARSCPGLTLQSKNLDLEYVPALPAPFNSELSRAVISLV